ncbi:MAG: hypothetical protein EA420_19605 [Candidatus Competibacteraceae bacterium]|nr:MAG: hypothetical protein EA420_19605 [Candidatus Competibacteraceae bacterium]
MKQILQSLKTGATEVANVPCPAVQRGQLLIRTSHTLVSAGTERMLVEGGRPARFRRETAVFDAGRAGGDHRDAIPLSPRPSPTKGEGRTGFLRLSPFTLHL